MLFAATYLGIPVSTTHTVTGAVIGVGAAKKVSAVRWNIAGNIVVAWIITHPGGGADGGRLLSFDWTGGMIVLDQGKSRFTQSGPSRPFI